MLQEEPDVTSDERKQIVDYLNKRHAAGADPDPALREYINEHLEWFRILREYHDYVTQYGSIDISFCEAREGVVRTYLQDALQVHEVVAPVMTGLAAQRLLIPE